MRHAVNVLTMPQVLGALGGAYRCSVPQQLIGKGWCTRRAGSLPAAAGAGRRLGGGASLAGHSWESVHSTILSRALLARCLLARCPPGRLLLMRTTCLGLQHLPGHPRITPAALYRAGGAQHAAMGAPGLCGGPQEEAGEQCPGLASGFGLGADAPGLPAPLGPWPWWCRRGHRPAIQVRY
jgi:hypothetical protein